MGKGDTPRPTDNERYGANYDAIKFGDIAKRGGRKKVKRTNTGVRVVYGVAK